MPEVIHYARPGWRIVQPPMAVTGRGLIMVAKREKDAKPIYAGEIIHHGSIEYTVISMELADNRDEVGFLVAPVRVDPALAEIQQDVIDKAIIKAALGSGIKHGTVGQKHDHGKPRFDLLPHRAIREMTMVLTFGAKKYAAENWRKVPGWRWRYYRAALGHLMSWWGGEVVDPESGLHHLAHAMCCVGFLLELDGERSPPSAWEGSEPPWASDAREA